ncbi:ketopantoate reductase family protein [Actinacidiphila acididurans]|uniref:2-dehydropantoate 2-reductase n=1 Tax=Actinacidiphila acididurans TaxID=2784346 RepID=A0ABS2TJF9_9ACTN|nr:2-dehydropantoate 2-reductase [Actinacidiphila acididurans]MBM9503484.1 2-dehydropantoate 2-reductase [Actinacidiphila acididurans]
MERILVVGAGATGGYFGARLAQAGRDVTFLVRPPRAELLREQGLRLTGPAEDEVLHPRVVTAGELAEPYDIVLISVKADALSAAADDMAPAVGPQTLVVPFLNGMAHLDLLGERFGPAVLGGVVRVVTQLGADGAIVQLAPGADMVIGERGGGRSERVDAAGRVLKADGYDFTVSDDVVGAMWQKWVFIATAMAVTYLAGGTVGEAAAVVGGPEAATAILTEAASVARAAGHPVPGGVFAATDAVMTRPGSPFAPSMYRDLTAGRPAEVEHVLGDLVARAHDLSVPVPRLELAAVRGRVHNNRIAIAAAQDRTAS